MFCILTNFCFKNLDLADKRLTHFDFSLTASFTVLFFSRFLLHMCVCVCLWVNLFDVISLGVKVYQSLPFRTPLHPQVERQATLRTVDGSQTFMVMKARYSQSQ